MNNEIINEISHDLNIRKDQVTKTLSLLEEGNTIPFIARYRKEATGNLDEEQIRAISEVYKYQVNLLERKEDVIRLIDEKGLMTDELKAQIMRSTKLVEVEDLYRPYKEKKKTKATEAIKKGLEPLAQLFLSFPLDSNIDHLITPFITGEVLSKEEAILGAEHIISEIVSDNAAYRKWIREFTYQNGTLASKLKKDAVDEKQVFGMYYEYSSKLKQEKPHRILALNRGEKEKVLNVSLDIDSDSIITYLQKQVIKNELSITVPYVKEAIADSYKRLIKPSIEREIRTELSSMSEDVAIDNFATNLNNLLLQPPMKEKIVLGFDPAFRTGCKLAVVDKTGAKINVAVIYPHEPKNLYAESKKVILDLISKYNIDIIAIGNGTASRESEVFIADVIKDASKKVEYLIVNEAGASVYSASPLAIEEFPDLHVEERSAISIGRRLQDPLSELVKIDPESIGVGLYQHDVTPKKLKESLDFVVQKAVNQVGVNVNTASPSLLKYVSGITKKHTDKLIEYRSTKGKIGSRSELKKLLTDKVYQQAIGFLRIVDGKNILDQTGIHPESYDVTLKLLESLNFSLMDLGNNDLKDKLQQLDVVNVSTELKTDKYTLEDIINNLIRPNRDPRDDMPKPLLRSDVLELADLRVGMMLEGTVRNVVDFGVFIDIGLKNDGLAHISKLSNRFLRHPSEILGVGDIVNCYVDEIFLDKKKVSLSLIPPKQDQENLA